jgi:hypothetical protein
VGEISAAELDDAQHVVKRHLGESAYANSSPMMGADPARLGYHGSGQALALLREPMAKAAIPSPFTTPSLVNKAGLMMESASAAPIRYARRRPNVQTTTATVATERLGRVTGQVEASGQSPPLHGRATATLRWCRYPLCFEFVSLL